MYAVDGKMDLNCGDTPRMGMEAEDYRKAAHDMVDYIIGYHSQLNDKQPAPDVKPGFIQDLLPDHAPEERELWQDVFKDLDEVVLESTTHWHSGNFFGFYPTASSFPAMLGDMLSTAVACIGFTWASSPSCTELEMVMMNWLGKALNLPESFLFTESGKGGGVIQGTASEATLMTLIAARSRAVRNQIAANPDQSACDIVNRMVAYTSTISHSSVEKASQIALVQMQLLKVDEKGSMRGHTLRQQIINDKEDGKIPAYVCVTFGTTSTCSFDDLKEIGEICQEEGIWLHVDAAYAGVALLCPELRYLAEGLERADSFNFNPHKMMMVTFDCSALWVKNHVSLINSFNVDPVYLRHENQANAVDYMNWQIPLGRRFRSLKLWFVMRMVGLEGLRSRVRRAVAEAKYFESLVREDDRFEVLFPVTFGLVCFRARYKDDSSQEDLNALNRRIHDAIGKDKRVFLSPSCVDGVYFLRVVAGNVNTSRESLERCWAVVRQIYQQVTSQKVCDF